MPAALQVFVPFLHRPTPAVPAGPSSRRCWRRARDAALVHMPVAIVVVADGAAGLESRGGDTACAGAVGGARDVAGLGAGVAEAHAVGVRGPVVAGVLGTQTQPGLTTLQVPSRALAQSSTPAAGDVHAISAAPAQAVAPSLHAPWRPVLQAWLGTLSSALARAVVVEAIANLGAGHAGRAGVRLPVCAGGDGGGAGADAAAHGAEALVRLHGRRCRRRRRTPRPGSPPAQAPERPAAPVRAGLAEAHALRAVRPTGRGAGSRRRRSRRSRRPCRRSRCGPIASSTEFNVKTNNRPAHAGLGAGAAHARLPGHAGAAAAGVAVLVDHAIAIVVVDADHRPRPWLSL